MLIFLTGDIGVGKSTVCQKIVRLIKSHGIICSGIISYKVDDEILVEDVSSGAKKILASTRIMFNGPHTLKYSFNQEGILFAIKAIEDNTNSDCLIIDEIGPLELRGEGFAPSLKIVQNLGTKNCLIVVRRALLSSFRSFFQGKPIVFITNVNNRDFLFREITSAMYPKLINGRNSFP